MAPYTILVEFSLRDGALDQFLPLIEGNATASIRDEPGCERFDVLVPAGERDRVLLYEIYSDLAAFERHSEQPHYHEFARRAEPMVRSKRVTVLGLMNGPGF